MFKYTLVLLVLLLAASVPAAASDGAIPIWEPTTITQSGKYRVTRNITSATTPAISIQAADVEIDLNGFTVRGGIRILDLSGTSVDPLFNIENGTIIGSVFVSGEGGTAVVRNLVVKNGGIVIVDRTEYATIENNVIHDATVGIVVELVDNCCCSILSPKG